MELPTTPTEILAASHNGLILDALGKRVSFSWDGDGGIDNEGETFTWAEIAELIEGYSTDTQLYFNY